MKIAVINTGGTISCVGEPLAPMTAQAFAGACHVLLDPVLRQQFPDIEVTYLTKVTFPESDTQTLDSTNLQPADWCIMARGVLDHYADYAGFVILHGTDSMDFTGTALTFLLNAFDLNGYGTAVLSKPVIITGSQVPMFYRENSNTELTLNFNTDAYQNFCGAVACARSGIPEVCVYFQDYLYRGSRILKTNASEFNAFSSPNYPALAEYGVNLTLYSGHWLPGPVHYSVSLDNADVRAVQQASLDTVKSNVNRFPVMQFNAFPAWYTMVPPGSFIADMINSMVIAGVKGLILESYGEGNFPSGNPDNPVAGSIFKALSSANAQGVNIVDCTQVIAGTVNSSAYAAGSWLPKVGALASADMSPMAALVKLMLLMTLADRNGWSRAQVQSLLQINLAGEMSSVNALDSRMNDVLHPGQFIRTPDGSAFLVNDQSKGPILANADGSVLWSLPITFSENDMPGRLVMQNDGNLVFYNRCNKPYWATGTGISDGASSKLTLTGSSDALNPANSTLLLQVCNYSDMSVSVIIYQSI